MENLDTLYGLPKSSQKDKRLLLVLSCQLVFDSFRYSTSDFQVTGTTMADIKNTEPPYFGKPIYLPSFLFEEKTRRGELSLGQRRHLRKAGSLSRKFLSLMCISYGARAQITCSDTTETVISPSLIYLLHKRMQAQLHIHVILLCTGQPIYSISSTSLILFEQLQIHRFRTRGRSPNYLEGKKVNPWFKSRSHVS